MTAAPTHSVKGFDLSRLVGTAFAIIALLLVNKLGIPGNVVFFGILIVMITMSPEMAFKAFSLCFLGLVANQAIVLKTSVWTVARFIIPLLCVLRFTADLQALRKPLLRPPFLAALALFVLVAGVLSVMTGYYVQIALLKLISFTIGSFAVFLGVNVLAARRADMTEWFTAICLAVVLMGIATIPLGIGYNFRGEGMNVQGLFNGPFYHSNTLGPMSAMMTVLMAAVLIFGQYRNRLVCVPIAVCLMYFMWLTKSRTGAASLLIGLSVMVGTVLVVDRRRFFWLPLRVSRGTLIAMGAAVAGLLLSYELATGGGISSKVIAFAQKGRQSEELSLDQVLASRQGSIQQAWHNFLESPLIGIGFEVAKTQYFVDHASLFNAPIEKGFLPTAVLEETGTIGTIFFVAFVWLLLAHMLGTMNIPGLAMILTFLAVNCGEAIFFSLAGHGAFGWVMMAAGMLLGERCVVRLPPRVPSAAGPPALVPSRAASPMQYGG